VDLAVERAQQALREQRARERSGAAQPAPPASSQIPVHGGAAVESVQVVQRERQLAAAVGLGPWRGQGSEVGGGTAAACAREVCASMCVCIPCTARAESAGACPETRHTRTLGGEPASYTRPEEASGRVVRREGDLRRYAVERPNPGDARIYPCSLPSGKGLSCIVCAVVVALEATAYRTARYIT